MWLDSYMFITLASGLALIAFAWELCGIQIPNKTQTQKLRTARVILAISYLILAIPPFTELLAGGGIPDRQLITTFTVAVAACQSLLFTVTLLTLINPSFVTRERVLPQIVIVGAAVSIFIVVSLITEALWVYALASAAYAAQLTYYTLVFRNKYDESLLMMEEYYDDDQKERLLWAKIGFFSALAVGVMAFFSAWLSPTLYNVFTVIYVIFYGWFASRFINYVIKLNIYLPAVITPPEDVVAQKSNEPLAGLSSAEIESEKENLRIALERWVEELGFTNPDDSKEQIAHSLGTNKEFLNWYFQTEIKQDFRSWRICRRIEYAKQLMQKEDCASINDIAGQVGYSTKSNFYGHFKKLTGETPVEYRRRICKVSAE